MANREIFKRESFWERRSYKLEISLFLIAIAIIVYFVSSSDDANTLTKITSSSVVDVQEEIIDLEIGQKIKIGEATFVIEKLDKEKKIRKYVASGTFYIFTITVESSKPYIPEMKIVSGRNEIAPNYEIEKAFGNSLRQIEGNATGIKVFDVPNDLKNLYLNLDISYQNNTLIKL